MVQFLYGQRGVGLCLAQHIGNARRVQTLGRKFYAIFIPSLHRLHREGADHSVGLGAYGLALVIFHRPARAVVHGPAVECGDVAVIPASVQEQPVGVADVLPFAGQ